MLSKSQRRLSSSHALLERLCSQFQRCTLVSFEKSPEIKAHFYGAEYAKDNFPRRADPTLRFGLTARTLDSGVESGVDKFARRKHPMHLFIGLLRTWRTTLSENQRRLSGSHALLERLCSQFQRCTLIISDRNCNARAKTSSSRREAVRTSADSRSRSAVSLVYRTSMLSISACSFVNTSPFAFLGATAVSAASFSQCLIHSSIVSKRSRLGAKSSCSSA